MTQNIIKKYNLGIDEEKDHFLSFLNKKVRNNRKKLDQIEELSKKDKTTLKPEQIEKINSKAEVKENMKYIDTIRLMYYEALKTARDEGKFIPPTPTEGSTTTQKEEPTKIEAKKEEAAPVKPEVSEIERQEEIARITRENLSRVLNLVHFAQFFRDQSKAQEFKQVTDADIVYDLYAKIFTFSESDKFVKISDKINGAVNELVSYINQVDQPALRNKSYKHIQGVVENVANSTQFRNHKADVAVVQTRAPVESSAIGSIGSELKKGYEQPEKLDVPVEAERIVSKVATQQEKLRSPEKERVVEQPVSAKKEEARKDWGNVEDEEEEEPEEEAEEIQEEEQAPEEEQKKTADDEWSTVKARGKEKKPEEQQRGQRGGFRGGRGQGRGGYRKPREGEERREGETGGYRGNKEGGYRPRRQYGEGKEEVKEGQEGEQQQQQRGERGGYRGQGRGGYRGEGRGGYRGGNREGGYQGNREGGFSRGAPRSEYVPKQQEGERKEAPAS